MKLWGGRFSKEPDRLFFDFSSSIETDSHLWREEILQNAAYTEALFRSGILTEKEKQDILCGLKELYLQALDGKSFWNEQDEDIHSAVERSLYEIVGEAALKIHTGRSRNEQIATDLRLYLKRKIVDIARGITLVHSSILKKAFKHIDDILPGYTHLQRAQPVRLAHHLLSWFFMLKRDFDRFVSAYKKMDFCPLGSGAIAGNSFGIDRFFLSEALGFKEPLQNSIDAVSDRDFVLHFLSQSANLSLHLSRFSEELVLWSTAEFNFVEVGEEFCTGSSLMPQKKNPDSLELIRAFAGRVIGAWVQVATVLKALPMSYNRDLQEDRSYACSVAESIETVLRIFSEVVDSLVFKTGNMLEASKDEYLLVTEMADYLVRKGIPFRKAHEISGRVVKLSEEKGLLPSQLAIEDLKSISPEFEEDYYEIFDALKAVDRKNSYGGTSKESVLEQLRIASEILDREKEWVVKQEEKQKAVFEMLFGSQDSGL